MKMNDEHLDAVEDTTEDFNSYHISRRQFDKLLPFLSEMRDGLIEFLKTPDRSITLKSSPMQAELR